jgi:GNAT superfamily N-acetyltransferase
VTQFRIEKLNRGHPTNSFDCGEEPLNRFLARYALQNQQANASQTYVALVGDKIVGFCVLVVGEIAYDIAHERMTKGLARYPVPIMLLARLAVDVEWQGRKVGGGLLKDAVLRTLQASEIAGIRALTVHAKDERAAAYYEHMGFLKSPTDPLHLFRLIRDLRAFLAH